MPKYDAEYFIEKFSAIPEEEWTIWNFVDRSKGGKELHCAYGHCGCKASYTDTEEGVALWKLFDGFGSAMLVNDGGDIRFRQPTPRARILAALRQIRTTEKEKESK